MRECLIFAKEQGIRITATYEDRAVSGKTDRRPNFQRMMKDAEKRKFQYVIAWKSNRMGRNMLQAMMNEARLNDLGVRVLYTEEDFDNTAAGRFALRSMMNVNQFYSENMAEDIRRGLMDNAMQCKVTNGTLPFGYKKDENLHYVLDPPNDEIVREIFGIDLPWLLDAFGPVKHVYAEKDKLSGLEIDYPDSYFVTLRHENGTKGLLAADVVSPKAVRNFEVFGEGLHLFWEGNPRALYSYNAETREKEFVDTYGSFEHDARYSDNIVENAYVDEITNFFGVLAGREQPRWSFEKDKEAIALIERIEGA